MDEEKDEGKGRVRGKERMRGREGQGEEKGKGERKDEKGKIKLVKEKECDPSKIRAGNKVTALQVN